MALFKIKLGLLHLPPLTEGIAFGLNYGIGFVLIHLLGFTVATKQPAMTAASIAATIEEARPAAASSSPSWRCSRSSSRCCTCRR